MAHSMLPYFVLDWQFFLSQPLPVVTGAACRAARKPSSFTQTFPAGNRS
jgi:hypothetical protein